MTIQNLNEPGRIAKPAKKPATPGERYQAEAAAARTYAQLVEARHRLEKAAGLLSEPVSEATQPAAPTDQALREAFGQIGLDPGAASLAAAGRYGDPAPEPAPEDAYDEYVRLHNMPPGSAAIMRRGRYL